MTVEPSPLFQQIRDIVRQKKKPAAVDRELRALVAKEMLTASPLMGHVLNDFYGGCCDLGRHLNKNALVMLERQNIYRYDPEHHSDVTTYTVNDLPSGRCLKFVINMQDAVTQTKMSESVVTDTAKDLALKKKFVMLYDAIPDKAKYPYLRTNEDAAFAARVKSMARLLIS